MGSTLRWVVAGSAAAVVAVLGIAAIQSLLTPACSDGKIIEIGQVSAGRLDTGDVARFCLEIGGDGDNFEAVVNASGDTTLTLRYGEEVIAFNDDFYGLDPSIYGFWEPGQYVLEVRNISRNEETVTFELLVD